jgi:signal peptidase I
MSAPRHATPRRRRRWRAWLVVVLVAVAGAYLVRTFVFESFYVPSGSMLPTIQIGDRMIVDKLSYDLHPVGFGNIVVFRRPRSDPAPGYIHYLVKRVIGLPGQTIWSHDGRVYIDGKPIPEPFLPRGVETTGIRRQRIPQGEYFVLGDNRGDSVDSRVFGPVSRHLIVGRVILIYWPLSQWHFF